MNKSSETGSPGDTLSSPSRRVLTEAGMLKVYRIALPVLALLLAVFVLLSWPAIQDDALIHLRYADNLRRLHFVTYDGVTPNFGTSSLLFVSVLAFLTQLTASPNLPRLVSTVCHLLLSGALVVVAIRIVPASARLARLLMLLLIGIFVCPSAVRWLEDGMETSMVLCLVLLLAVIVFPLSRRQTLSVGEKGGLFVLSFGLVLIRSELTLLVGTAWFILIAGRERRAQTPTLQTRIARGFETLYLPLGGLASCLFVLGTMHHLLPDTALAKADGLHEWFGVLSSTAIVLTGAFLIGIGLAAFWLGTLLLVWMRAQLTPATLLANTLFPVLLLLSALRGQQMQGARYVLWTFLFSSLWNILTIADPRPADLKSSEPAVDRRQIFVAAGLVLILLLLLPIDIVSMYRVLTRRAHTMRSISGEHLQQLSGLQGTSMDIGYVGYFTQANICDLAGLVNGRAAAALTVTERGRRCAALKPDFVFGNASQIDLVTQFQSLRGWRICDGYDFVNVRGADRHYLVASPRSAEKVCAAAGKEPSSVDDLIRIVPRAAH